MINLWDAQVELHAASRVNIIGTIRGDMHRLQSNRSIDITFERSSAGQHACLDAHMMLFQIENLNPRQNIMALMATLGTGIP